MTSGAAQVLAYIVQAALLHLQGRKLLCALFYVCLIYAVARAPLGQIQNSTVGLERQDVDCTQDAKCTVCSLTSEIMGCVRGIKHQGGEGQTEQHVPIPCIALV